MKLLIAAGGTAGHVLPALAVVEELRQRCDSFEGTLVGRRGGVEKTLAEEAGLSFEGLWIEGWVHRSIPARARALGKLPFAFIQSRFILNRFQPDVVLGMGSYVSLPVMLVASRLRIRTLIHEQNRAPGLANRMCASRVDRIAASFPVDSSVFPEKKTTLTGVPIRSELLRASSPATPSEDRLRVLVFGGSQGAQLLNQSLLDALTHIDPSDYQFQLLAGREHADGLRDSLRSSKHSIKVHGYLQNMGAAYSWADLIICRGGASTLAEITALGKPAIIVPLENPDQLANADFLGENGGATVLRGSELTGARLAETLEELRSDPAQRAEMARIAASKGLPDAAGKVAEMILELETGQSSG